MRRNPALRVLFVEPPTDPLFDLSSRRIPTLPCLRTIAADGRLRALRPLKLLPRRAGPLADILLRLQVVLASRLLGFEQPHLWVNDVTYAPLLTSTGWPSVYDVTDDWLLAPFAAARTRAIAPTRCAGAGQCGRSRRLFASARGESRPSAGRHPDPQRRRRRTLPSATRASRDLPASPVAVYVGSLHDARIDVELTGELARTLPQLNIALVGPDSLSPASQSLLRRLPNVFLLGRRPYGECPAYLQHADVIDRASSRLVVHGQPRPDQGLRVPSPHDTHGRNSRRRLSGVRDGAQRGRR